MAANMLWFYNEYFYSNYDRKYFEGQPMRELYLALGLKPTAVTLKQHRQLMMALPAPRLFCEEFLVQERLKLEEFRNSCRQSNTKNVPLVDTQLPKNSESSIDFPVQSIVLALHPMCGHLHPCSIMAYYK
jgi:hypothetical protein